MMYVMLLLILSLVSLMLYIGYVTMIVNINYVDDIFIRAHFTHNKINKIQIQHLLKEGYNYAYSYQLSFYDENDTRYVCRGYSYTNTTAKTYSEKVESDIKKILGNDYLVIMYAADPHTVQLLLKID